MTQFYLYTMPAHLQVSGEDAAEFLQSQFSRDLRSLQPGEAVYGLWLDVKGKIAADSWLHRDGGERFRIFSEHCPGSVIAEKLERHIIADDVEIESLGGAEAIALIGEGCRDGLHAADGVSAVLPGRRARDVSVECVFEGGEAREAFTRDLAGSPLRQNELDFLRMDAGVPLVPCEAGNGELPGEVGLEGSAVDLDKGCFLGQEVVARMHNLGKPTRALYLVMGSGALPDCPAAVLSESGKRAGELRSAMAVNGGWQGVALLKIRQLSGALSLAAGEGAIEVERKFSGEGAQ